MESENMDASKVGATLTSAALARLVGVSERRVATVKAEGRLPLTSGDKIDLAELVRRGWGASLAAKGHDAPNHEPTAEERAALRGLAPMLDFTAPMHSGFALGALLGLHEAPICAALAAAEVGVPRGQAEAVADLLLLMLWDALNDHAHTWGLPDAGTDGPIYGAAGIEGWRDGVDWRALYDDAGGSMVAGRIAADSIAEAEA